MEIQALAKHIRVSPRKLKLLVKSIKEQKPEQAVSTLDFLNKSGSLPLKKLVKSALANAKNANMDLLKTNFKEIQVLPGGAMKRFRAVSRGMAHTYKKRMSHVKVILTDEDKSKTQKIKKSKE